MHLRTRQPWADLIDTDDEDELPGSNEALCEQQSGPAFSSVAPALSPETLRTDEQSSWDESNSTKSKKQDSSKRDLPLAGMAKSPASRQQSEPGLPMAYPCLSGRGRSPTIRSLEVPICIAGPAFQMAYAPSMSNLEHEPRRGISCMVGELHARRCADLSMQAGLASLLNSDASGLGECTPFSVAQGTRGASVGSLSFPDNKHKMSSRGRSLTPRLLRFSPKPALALTHAASVAPASSTGRLQRLGNIRDARSVAPQSCEQASNSSTGNCLGGGCVPNVMDFLENSENVCSPKHELRNVEKGFNATLGYPGEGPGDRGRAATPSSASAPVTPPNTPPKAANLEVEVRGVVDSYLQSGAWSLQSHVGFLSLPLRL